MRIGIAGLGRMGAAMALRLIEQGHDVAVWNRTPERAAPLAQAGATVAESPASLAAAAETAITMLTDAAAMPTVYEGPCGLLANDVAGRLFVEMSTVRPETTVALATKVARAEAAFVECPVGGTVGPARARGLELPVAPSALGVYDQASREGWGARDGTELPAYWSRRAAER